MTSKKDIAAAQTELEKQVFDLSGVVGVSIGECDGESCLNVMIEMDATELLQKIPERINGVKVNVVTTGVIGIQKQ